MKSLWATNCLTSKTGTMEEKKDYIATLTIAEKKCGQPLAYANADGTVSSYRTAEELKESNEEYWR